MITAQGIKRITLGILVTILCLFSSPNITYAGSVLAEFDATITAFIDQDKYSSITISPTNNEIGRYSDVRVRILDRNNNPIPGRNVFLYVDVGVANISFVQPSVTDGDGYAYGKVSGNQIGAYTIKARDITYSNDIFILASANFYVFTVPAPKMVQEPYYTKGTSNTVYWTHTGLGDYKYKVEISKDPSFGDILGNSGWIDNKYYTFTDLLDSNLYYYRVVAKNNFNFTSSYSDITFSIQDAIPPKIDIVTPPVFKEKDNRYVIEIGADITDNLALKSVNAYCKRNDGKLIDCGYLEKKGTVYTLTVDFSSLGNDYVNDQNKFEFCYTADDVAGNISTKCDITLDVEEGFDFDNEFLDYISDLINNGFNIINSINNYIVTSIENSTHTILYFISSIIIVILYILLFLILAGSTHLFNNYLYYILSQIKYLFTPFLLRKRIVKVINSVTNKPVYLARVKIYNASHDLVYSSVTNILGEVYGALQTGKYRIVVEHPDYLFPSLIYGKSKTDETQSTYYGEYVFVGKRNPLDKLVPIDQISVIIKDDLRYKKLYRVLNIFKYFIFILFVILLPIILYLLFNYQNILTYILATLYSLLIPIYIIQMNNRLNMNKELLKN